jgi:hypothetical protein
MIKIQVSLLIIFMSIFGVSIEATRILREGRKDKGRDSISHTLAKLIRKTESYYNSESDETDPKSRSKEVSTTEPTTNIVSSLMSRLLLFSYEC